MDFNDLFTLHKTMTQVVCNKCHFINVCTLHSLPSYASAILPEHQRNSDGLAAPLDFAPVLGAFQPYSPLRLERERIPDCKNRRGVSNPILGNNNNICCRRIRGEKKPIPDEQKDDRYFERRKRNNQAAKKSRDARKLREDQIALRAAILEHENAVLRAQILTLREETQALRRLLLINSKASVCDTTRRDVSKDHPLPQGAILSPTNPSFHIGRTLKEVYE